MKRIIGILLAVGLSISAIAPLTFAQQPQPVPERTMVLRQDRIFQTPEGTPLPPPGADFVFMASENFGGKVVKGAPYSAEAVSETIQTLADGNRIVNRITSQVYRDSEGRTRRDQTLKGLGVLGSGEEPLQTIFINDPVAGVTYSLDSRTHIAHKSMPFTFKFTTADNGKGSEAQKFEYKISQGPATGVVVTSPPAGAPPPAGARIEGAEAGQFNLRTEGTSTFVFRTKPNTNANEVKEQLGKQTIEGVEAEGTRTTVTIPAGEIGNDRPIEVVSERWYSPELQLVVMTKHSDPRFGETTYKLTNINRTEPAKSLFEVPPGYTVKDMQFGMPNIAPLPRKKSNPE